MADQEKKSLDIDDLEVTELVDQDLEDVTGGVSSEPVLNNCPITNFNCIPSGSGGSQT
jgi:hypothetical protein